MNFPDYRPRRMRRTPALRSLIAETRLAASDFVLPLFVLPGTQIEKPVASMPGVCQLSVDKAVTWAQRAEAAGVPAVLLFGIPSKKDGVGSEAWNANGVVQRAIKEIKKACPALAVMVDACFCEYTDHGHCGVLTDGQLDNDATLENLGRTAVSYARAGADVIAPSGMLDGFVAATREALDDEHFTDVAIMAYSAKYASAYYGPFRDAAHSAPKAGDRRSYQMDPANVAEALREASMDAAEGADIIMVKPALAYLDVVRAVSDEINLPIAVYNVSGEYAMVEAAAKAGWIDHDRIMMETLLGMRRAGADIIITYHALAAAALLNK